MRSIRLAALLAGLLLVAPPAPAEVAVGALDAAVAAAGAAPDPAARIRADVAWLADDAREGREAGTAGYDAAAAYVARRFESVGLKPAGTDGWMQPMTLRRGRRIVDSAKLDLVRDGGVETLTPLADYLAGRSFRTPTFSAEGGLVYAGYGVVDPSGARDDYKGLDVAGKIVVVFSGAPATYDSERRAHFASNAEKLENAAARGAIGLLVLPTEASDRRAPWARAVDNPRAAAMVYVAPDGTTSAPAIEATALVSASGAEKLFRGAPTAYAALRAAEAAGGAPAGFALPGTARFSGATELEDVRSANVVGIIEGSDKRLRREFVALTAHLDHIGITPTRKGGDAINNGALDNAIGVATLIEAARALGKGGRPKRSVVFVALTGEEKGLLGSRYFARFPSVDGEIVADVNLDMPLLLFPFTDVVAFGAERSSLGPVVARAANGMGIALSPDPVPEQSLFTRSDHYSFVQRGVPSVFLFVGFADGGKKVFDDFIAKDYHHPSDEIALPIDYASAARFAELNTRIAREVATTRARPRWKKGDFFGALSAAR